MGYLSKTGSEVFVGNPNRHPMRRWAATAGLLASAVLLGACSGVTLPKLGLDSQSAGSEPLRPAPPPAEELVGADGRCSNLPADASPTGTPVGLDMSECEVVRRAGIPERVEIEADPRGQRTAVLTYSSGLQAGLYRFVAGRLAMVERLPEPPAPQRPARKGRPRR